MLYTVQYMYFFLRVTYITQNEDVEEGCIYVYLDIDGKLIFSFDYYDYIIKKKTIRLYS